MRSLGKLLLAASLLLAAQPACGDGAKLSYERRATTKAIQKRLSAFENPGLEIGNFALANKTVIDGDTVHVEGLGTSLRLLGVDAEETFKYEKERRAFEVGWADY